MQTSLERFAFLVFLTVWCVVMWRLMAAAPVPQNTPVLTQLSAFVHRDELPKLYTEKNTIKRLDTHSDVILKGFTSEAFRGEKSDIVLAKTHVDIVRTWGANIINFYVNPNLFLNTEDNWSGLDEVIQYARKQHVYVSIQPVVSYKENKEFDRGGGYDKALEFIEKIRLVVPRIVYHYQKYPHVLFGTWTEPHPFSAYEPYFEMTKNIIRTIHATYPHVLFMVDVSMGDLYELEHQQLIRTNNIIYHRSYYYGKDIADVGLPTVTEAELVGTGSGVMAAPYMVSEMGAYYGGDFNSGEDIITTKKMLDVLQKHAIPYMGYVLDDYHVLALTDALGNPTKKGSMFIEHLKKYPPTKF